MFDQILVRYGDLTLKGKNKRLFLNKLFKLVKNKLNHLDVEIINTYDRIYINVLNEDHQKIIDALNTVAGLNSYSLVRTCDNDLDQIIEKSINLISSLVKEEVTFKVNTKRANKNFFLTSLEVSQKVAAGVLRNVNNLKVDVRNPKLTLNIEIRDDKTYLYTNEEKGLGGFPVGVAGKGLVMISGGIDSPVAAFLAQKQGIEVECIHFESTPLTSIESAQKVIDLTKIVAKYAPNNKIKVHMVPFKDLHMQILDRVPEQYMITIMRRMMYRIAEKVANKNKCLCLINGESVGQVASQTLQSMSVINEVVNIPVLRPLATYDKNDIIRIARNIKTFDTSIRPFEDCCTIYVPKSPATAPKSDICVEYETYFDYAKYVEEAVENIKDVVIDVKSDLDLTFLGLEVKNVL